MIVLLPTIPLDTFLWARVYVHYNGVYNIVKRHFLLSLSDHLKIHMKTHDNQKPFQCTVCNRGYSTAAALTSHMQNHHKRAAERSNSPQISGPSYKCLQCTQIFRKPDELQVSARQPRILLLTGHNIVPFFRSSLQNS